MKLMRLAVTVLFVAVWVFPGPALAGDRVLFYHNDALGSPVVMTDSAGNVAWRADYEPFGEISALVDTLQAPNTHQFIGKEADPETGLHYLSARYYDGNIGRFLSVDPALRLNIPHIALATPQLLNNYGYSANNPYRFIDRDGRFIVLLPLALAVGGAFITNVFFPSTVNAPSDSLNLSNAQTPGEFALGAVVLETAGFIGGKVFSGSGKAGSTSVIAGTSTSSMVRSLDEAATLRGASSEEIQGLIPQNWTASTTRSGGGTRFANPERPGEQVRIMPGNKNDPNLVKQGPYARISKDGAVSDPIPLKGNPVLE